MALVPDTRLRGRTLAQRLYAFHTVDDNGCWIWTRVVTGGGYGSVWDGSRMVAAHRASYETFRGEIPADMSIDHLCRVRRCINPAHLEVVTQYENVMRGEGPTARQRRQTHCKYGHPLVEENLLGFPSTRKKRDCKLCHRERNRRYKDARARR